MPNPNCSWCGGNGGACDLCDDLSTNEDAYSDDSYESPEPFDDNQADTEDEMDSSLGW